MNRPRRRRKSSRSEAATAQVSFPQLDRQVLRNRFAPVEPLDDEQMALIHEATMTLLEDQGIDCLLYTSPSPRDATLSRMPSSA